MNKALKNIKSNILVDFICSDVASITIITYKVTISLDLQTINVKNEKSRLNIFLIFFLIYFLYSIFRTRVRVRVTRSCCHTAGHIR